MSENYKNNIHDKSCKDLLFNKATIEGQDVFFYMILEFQSSVDYRMLKV